MEVLNYSLWFTFGWWILLVFGVARKQSIEWFLYINDLIVVPIIVVLLEYLIMR